MECPTCHFVVSPSETAQGTCQVCGTDLRPERDQPGGSPSDGRLRNMKEPGYGQDMGGNPLQEGILGDWQNRDVRDESFASVHARLTEAGPGIRPHNPRHPHTPYEEGESAYRTQGPSQAVELQVFQKDEGTGAYLVGSDPEAANWYYPEEISRFPDVEHAIRMLDPESLTPEMFQHPDPWMDNEPGTLKLPSASVISSMYRKDSTVDDWFERRSDVVLPWWVRTAAAGTAQIEPSGGIHNGVVGLLRFLQAKVGGVDSLTQPRDIVQAYSPFAFLGQPDMMRQWGEWVAQNPTVTVETPYDEYLPVAVDIIQTGATQSRVPDSLKQLAQQMHAGAVPFPPGVSPEQVRIASWEKEANPALLAALRAGGGALLRGATSQGGRVLPGAWAGAKGLAKKAPGVLGRAAIYHQLGSALFGGAAGQQPSTPPQQMLRGYEQLAHSIHASITADYNIDGTGIPTHGMDDYTDPATYHDGFCIHCSAPLPPGEINCPNCGAPQAANPAEYQLGNDLYSAVETPESIDEIGVQADDPEQVDPHELNDGDHGAYRQDVNDIGGSSEGLPEQADDNFTTGDEHWDRFVDSIPKLLYYYESDESGLADPDIRELAERMNGIDPEWSSKTDGLEAVKLGALPYGTVPTGNPSPMLNQQPVPGQASPEGGVNGVCNVCGAGLNADGSCPAGHQGGAGVRQPLPGLPPTPQVVQGVQPIAKTAINDHQGPKNAEQFAAVAELLQEQGREVEIPGMLKEPWKYAEELAQVQNNPNKPPIDLSAPEGMQPAQEQAPPGATMPQPGMTAPAPGMPLASITAAFTRLGADSLAPRCPKCGSATTGIANEDGDCHCHRCGNDWSPEGVEKTLLANAYFKSTPRVEAPDHTDLHIDNSEAVPEADQHQQEDLRQEEDTGRTWTTEDGEPLKVGQTYELSSQQFSIPDLVQVQAIKPDAINLKFIGEYSAHGGPEEEQLAYEHEVSREEAQLGAYTFTPAGGQEHEPDSELLNEQQAIDPTSAPGDQTDLSTPHERMTKVVEQLVRKGHGLKEATAMAKEVLAVYPGYEPSEYTHRDDYYKPPLERGGQPPAGGEVENAVIQPGITWTGGYGRGILAQDGTVHAWPEEHGTHAQWIQGTGIQPEAMFEVGPQGEIKPYSFEGAVDFTPTQEQAILAADPRFSVDATLTGEGADLFNFASVPDSHDKAMAEFEVQHDDPDLAWLKDGSGPGPEVPDDPNDELAWLKSGGFEEKTAGRRFTPSQQKDFIDEEGEARNRDKLSLEGTHYTGYGEGAPEEHPGLFL